MVEPRRKSLITAPRRRRFLSKCGWRLPVGRRTISGSRLTHPLTLAVGLALSFGGFSLLAALRFPHIFGPWSDNTLSQLGNSHLNPNGYLFYLVGCALGGVLAIGFFVSLNRWRGTGSQRQNLLLTLVQLLGVFGGLGLFMNAVFPETNYALHHFFAGIVFNGFGAAVVLCPFSLWRRTGGNVVLTTTSLLTLVAVVLMFGFARDHWVEWVPTTLFLAMPILVGFQTRATQRPDEDELCDFDPLNSEL
jgi:hypothetical membrane protein